MNEEKVYVVYSDWRDRMNEPELIGVYRDENKARKIRLETIEEYVNDGNEEDEDFRIWIDIMYIE